MLTLAAAQYLLAERSVFVWWVGVFCAVLAFGPLLYCIGFFVYGIFWGERKDEAARNAAFYERRQNNDETRELEKKINWHEMQAERGYKDEPGVDHREEAERLTRKLNRLRRKLLKRKSWES